jgi:DNA-binding winged helix-turn-helix (wHTH) protein/TolB-like protein/Flp pilus assembly protein TadD
MTRLADLQTVYEPGSEDPPSYRLCFGGFQFDVASGELHRGRTTITIQHQPAKVLQYLAERPGAIVTRQELQQHVWRDGHFVDYDQGLNYCIKEVRRVLGDRADDPLFIETIPRRGYRFRAPVERKTGAQLALATAEPEPRRKSRAAALVVALVVSAITLGWVYLRQPPIGSVDSPRLAVLPLTSFSPGALPEGLVDELISRLAQRYQGNLGVIARSSSSRFAGSGRSAADIGSALGADYLLTGSVQREGAVNRVSAQLVRVADETTLWADIYDRQTGDASWRAWAQGVTTEVGLALDLPGYSESEPAADLPDAIYDRYLEGVYFANADQPAVRAQGLAIMEEVLAAEPDFVSAILVWARLERELGTPADFIPTVGAALQRAIDLDPRSADAHLELARLQLLHLRDRAGAERSVQRALDLSPRLAKAHHTQAMVLSAQGRHDEAFDAMRRALIFDPLSAELVSHAGWAHFLARQYEQAIEHSRRALSIDPASKVAHSCILYSALELGRDAAALEQARVLAGDDLASLDQFWLAMLRSYEASSLERGATVGMQAIPLIHLGRHDEAVGTLLRACHEGSSWPIAFAEVDPRLDPLRSHPRFGELLACASTPVGSSL